MRLSPKHIGLIIGILSVFVSLLFFGRKHNVYLMLSLVGCLVAFICLVWIQFSKGTLRSKLLSIAFVILCIAIELVTEGYLVGTSYKIYLAQHSDALSEVNHILGPAKGNVTVIGNTVELGQGIIMNPEVKERLLLNKKELGVYMILKTDSRIYFGLWGFLDVRIGVTFLPAKNISPDRTWHPTDSWF